MIFAQHNNRSAWLEWKSGAFNRAHIQVCGEQWILHCGEFKTLIDNRGQPESDSVAQWFFAEPPLNAKAQIEATSDPQWRRILESHPVLMPVVTRKAWLKFHSGALCPASVEEYFGRRMLIYEDFATIIRFNNTAKSPAVAQWFYDQEPTRGTNAMTRDDAIWGLRATDAEPIARHQAQ